MTPTIKVVTTTPIVVAICGSVTRQNTWLVVAPSILAASMSSVGTALIAADKITIEKPVWIQIMMIINQKLLYGVSWTKKIVSPSTVPSGRVRNPPTPPPTRPVKRMKNHPTSNSATPGTTILAYVRRTRARAIRMKSPMTASPNTAAVMIVGRPEPVDRRPSPTHSAFMTPVCSIDGSRAVYTKRQMTDAPTSEIAIGMKMIDFATRSPPRWSASTAMARPMAVETNVTTTTHQRLLMSVPRIAVKAPNVTSRIPTTRGAPVGLPTSTARPVRCFMTMPTTTAIPSRIAPMTNGTLVNMFDQLERSKLFGSWKTSV